MYHKHLTFYAHKSLWEGGCKTSYASIRKMHRFESCGEHYNILTYDYERKMYELWFYPL